MFHEFERNSTALKSNIYSKFTTEKITSIMINYITEFEHKTQACIVIRNEFKK